MATMLPMPSHHAPFASCNATNNAVGCGDTCFVFLGNPFRPKLLSSVPVCQGLGMPLSTRRLRAAAPLKKRTSERRGAAVVCEAQETITAAGDVNDTTFRKFVLESDIPVLVDFWAPWCGPCRMIAPLIDELARQYAGRLRCVKLNTDESPKTPTEYGIRSIPTVMIFKNGEKLDTIIGAVPKSTLTLTIEKYLP